MNKRPDEEKTRQARQEQDLQPRRDDQPSPDDLSTDDLVGESEYSVRVSGGGGRGARRKGGPPRRELSQIPEDMGRRELEESTEAWALEDEDEGD